MRPFPSSAPNAPASTRESTRATSGILFFLTLLLSTPAWSQTHYGTSLDLRLVLAVDCSFSVDAREFALQMQGIAEAFRSEEVIHAIKEGPHGRIAVLVMQWSNVSSQIVAVPWTVIEDSAGSLRFADQVGRTKRLTAEGGTSLSSALIFAAGLLGESGGDALRQVVDISADGRNNSGQEMALVRNAVVSRGITVNGLAVLDEVATLHRYFLQHVVGGRGFFVVEAKNYEAYSEAIHRKLIMEISGLPIS